MASVRLATYEDIDVLVEMGAAMHAESPRYRSMTYDAEKVRVLAVRLIQVDMGAVFVAESDGAVIGMAAVICGERWFGPDKYVTDFVVYLKPEHRGNGAFVRLVRLAEAWGREQGAQQMDLGVSTGVDAGRTVRAYEGLGYTLTDTSVMTKRLEDVHRS